jgi:hypothetical protein
MKPKISSKPIGKTKKEQQMIDLGKLPDKTSAAVDFLREHVRDVKGRVSNKGSQIQVEGLKHKEVKLLMHKFLRHNGLDDHRVLSQGGTLEIVPQHLVVHSRPQEGTPPPASATMPYLFPGASASMPTSKKSKKA